MKNQNQEEDGPNCLALILLTGLLASAVAMYSKGALYYIVGTETYVYVGT